MSAGVVSWGSYLPRYRLSGDVFADVWGVTSPGGERAVASYDEDSITMAVAASQMCLAGRKTSATDGLIFASTTPPYAEKQNSALIATALGLRRDIFVADHGGSVKCGLAALRSALDAVDCGSVDRVLVVAADCRVALPGSDLELNLGDGAAALMIGRDEVMVEIEGRLSITEEFLDIWRRQDERYLQQADPAFVSEYGYERLIREALDTLLHNHDLQMDEIAYIAFNAPSAKLHRRINRRIGIKGKGDLDQQLITRIGNTGSSFPLLLAIGALEEAKPGDRLTLIGYGGGVDAFLLKMASKHKEVAERARLKEEISGGRVLTNYGKYLKFRNHVVSREVVPFSSPVLYWREQAANLPLHAQRCRGCGAIQYPMRRVCWNCGLKDQFEDTPLPRRGRVFTYTKDYLVPSPDPPVVMAVIDLDGGGRIYAQLTDCDPDEVKIGFEVEATFRRLHQGAGFINYWWKFRPIDQ